MRTLLVASAGGHFEELRLLRSRFGVEPAQSTWVTWDTPQTRSMLASEEAVFVERSQPKDLRRVLHDARLARHMLGRGGWARVVSTGSIVAVPFLAVARSRGIPSHYIESAARLVGPSLSGRILERIPGVHCYSQSRAWASTRRSWSYRGSVFEAFAPSRREPRTLRRVVVSLGTSRYGFRRLVDTLRAVLPASVEVTWQVGPTDAGELGSRAYTEMPQRELATAMRHADLVVAHAGVGTALGAMEAGHCPVLVPRRKDRGEHVDDHQFELAAELGATGLATVFQPEEITLGGLVEAAQLGVTVRSVVQAFVLDES